ncbi:very short patch repair endonuclease [Bradyrhizobium canariense]|uniref:Very short patch repair endonuclease n=1 Tax=Bradyrhizobium canariense TaxID=255045 RepID=A0A1X3GVY7_9BRAD|nr:very short patch repair endonuclease [Bradyrhizobium canariense]OSI70860.1 very short patch repair endonuclease [Bradyrhizobium canariense]OSI79701.1 very short patch repair endonuclease [Bradyrhizobium canariense]OSI92318.1 very short patch repair endonuclease [Bradyrhizobium canariense]OSI94040.1 very short patch repair endonuclease [Bradyrhizobium canariense]OSJ01787.1 very short patch repair endonuclease [Bradyrhizobium canariense]
MVDIVDAATRSRMMSGIKGKNTKPEILVRTALHRLGFRYRLHSAKVPGKPDLVFPAIKAAVFVNGCFWHGHDCRLFKAPATRPEFWLTKIAGNKARDARVRVALEREGWRHLTIWECAIRGRDKLAVEKVIDRTAKWLRSKSARAEIRGR